MQGHRGHSALHGREAEGRGAWSQNGRGLQADFKKFKRFFFVKLSKASCHVWRHCAACKERGALFRKQMMNITVMRGIDIWFLSNAN